MAPLPIKFNPELECYKKMLENIGESGMAHLGPGIQKAQAIKDATMAHFILKNCQEGGTLLHFNGSYHSDHYQGIVWYVNEYNKKTETILKILTISSVEQKSVLDLEETNNGLADFIICVPEDMTKTQVSPAGSMAPSSKTPSAKPENMMNPADSTGSKGKK